MNARGADEAGALETLGRSSGPASLILSSLADGAKHGYALTKDIESFAGVRVAPGTLYEALSRLQAHGMIEAVESQDRRRPYRLTATGATALSTYLQAQRKVAEVGLRRLAGAGLFGHPLDSAAAARAGLAMIAACGGAAALAGAAMWAQLAIGLQWSVAHERGITEAMALMSAALLVLPVLALLAAAPVAWAALGAAVQGQGRQFRWPAALITAGLVVLVIGGRHFENGWPGTGGHLLVHQGLVPGGVAAFGWATTMWITTYWAHPAALAAFPPSELAWMVLSPAATGCVLTGAMKLIRRVELSPRAFRYQTRVANVAWAGLVVFLSGALSWLLSAGG